MSLDTQDSAQVANDALENSGDSNPLLQAAADLLDTFNMLNASEADSEASTAWYEEAPLLEGPARWSEGSAALCMSAFGSQIVPDIDQDRHGAIAQMALQIARVYMAEPMNSPVQNAFEALALVAQRRQNGNYCTVAD